MDAEAIKKKLSEEIDLCDWSMLEEHLKRDALLLLDPVLNLIDVGLAFAIDDSETVERWLQKGKIKKLQEEDRDNYANNKAQQFSFLIVQPFVLVQLEALH